MLILQVKPIWDLVPFDYLQIPQVTTIVHQVMLPYILILREVQILLVVFMLYTQILQVRLMEHLDTELYIPIRQVHTTLVQGLQL